MRLQKQLPLSKRNFGQAIEKNNPTRLQDNCCNNALLLASFIFAEMERVSFETVSAV